MKLLSSQQIKAWDKYTTQHEPISSVQLMERAAGACLEAISQKWERAKNHPVTVLCGSGNNGGDGLVIARMLLQRHIPVTVFICGDARNTSEENTISRKKLEQNFPDVLHTIESEADFPYFPDRDCVVVDSIFGTGLNKPLTGMLADLIQHLNKQQVCMVSVDLPSGMPVEPDPNWFDKPVPVVRANLTLTFQVPKISFFFTEFMPFVGEMEVLDIGLLPEFLNGIASEYELTTFDNATALLKPRIKTAHKGNFGHLLTAGGSFGKMGAAILMNKAALRTGCGLVTTCIPKTGYTILQTAIPECMVETDEEMLEIRTLPLNVDAYDAIAAGPGMGTNPVTVHALTEWLNGIHQPCVLDADALNGIAIHLNESKLKVRFPANCILTPHPKEFDRLLGQPSANSYDRLKKAVSFARKHQVTVVLKGAHTAIAMPDGHVFFNQSGNVALATAGSGDALTGIIGSFLAQGYPAADAAILGVYLHGFCADLLAQEQLTLLASDLIEKIPFALKIISGQDIPFRL